jgi:hypothetical protein
MDFVSRCLNPLLEMSFADQKKGGPQLAPMTWPFLCIQVPPLFEDAVFEPGPVR